MQEEIYFHPSSLFSNIFKVVEYFFSKEASQISASVSNPEYLVPGLLVAAIMNTCFLSSRPSISVNN